MKKLKSCNVQRKQIVKFFVFFSGRAKYVKKVVLKDKKLRKQMLKSAVERRNFC